MLASPLFIALLLFSCALWFVIALWASRSIKTNTDYYLASRELGALPITLTLLATQIGGGFLTGIAQESYYVGMHGIAYALGIVAGFLMLGLGVAARLRELQISTTAQLFELRYRSQTLKKIASFLSIISLWGILVAQMVALKTVLIALGITSEWVALAFWLSMIGYTMVGGLKASVTVDIVKELFIITLFVGIFLWSFIPFLPTLSSWAALAHLQDTFESTSIMRRVFPIFLMSGLFCLIEQDLAQCFFAARTRGVAMLSATYASIFLLLFSIAPVYFGMYARLHNLDLTGYTSPLIVVLNDICSSGIFALAAVALLTAIGTTANALLCAVSSNVALDFDFSWMRIGSRLSISRAITLLVGLSALVTSYLVSSTIVQILTVSYELSVNCLLVPSLFGYYGKNVSRYGAFLAIASGLFGFFFFRWYPPLYVPKEVATLLCSLLGYLVGATLEKKFYLYGLR